ncbi:MAG: zinc carboxypeptidase, partial [Saprospiraceae bacterium]|nr:zinc carboxypeptidase [Saprospiraceae bacterium]
QAGGRSTAVLLDNGDTLTLRDRVAHHKTTALSTIEIASQQADRLVDHFEEYFQQAVNSPQGDYKTYIVKGSNPPKRIKALCSLLDKNQIAYGRTSRSRSMEGYSYQTGKTVDINIEEGDLLISAYQPKSVLTQVLMEPKTALEDSLTYDITAWALPYAYGLETYATRIRIDPDASPRFPEYRHALSPDERPYAYVAAWNSLDDVRFLAALQKAGVKVRYATEPFAVEGHQYPRGTLIISRADNRKMGSHTARIVDRLARQFEPDIRAVQTGFVSKGPDFGSRAMEYIQQPRIAVIGGEGISIYSFGQVWHYFERELDYPIHIVDKDIMSSSDLDHYNLLIMPEGRYGIGNSEADRLDDWVSAGGRLIAIGSAVRSLEGEDGFEIAEFVEKEDEKSYEEEMEEEEMQLRLEAYGGAERRFIAGFIPGAIIKLQLDETHPLAFGLGDHYFSLKTNNLFYQHQTEAWNVARVEGEPLISGFVGAKAKKRLEKTTTFAVQERGRGAVIYLVDNPLYRAFWENGKFLFGNAVFFAGQ